MRSSNPVFSRRGFSHDVDYAGFNQSAGYSDTPRRNPYAAGNGYAASDLTPEQLRQRYQAPSAGARRTGRMTMDDVVVRTAVTLGTAIAGALLAWLVLPPSRVGAGPAAGCGVVAFVLAVIQSFKRTPAPALIIGYAVFEGVFLGVISRMYNQAWAGVPVQAVLGTMAVSVGMLVAYRARLVRVTQRYYRTGMAIAVGFLLVVVANLLFAALAGGSGLGVRSGGLGLVFAAGGVLLGAFFLSLDFKQIEEGVRQGAPRNESWLAAFGLTLSLVWIYLEMLRLLSILRSSDY